MITSYVIASITVFVLIVWIINYYQLKKANERFKAATDEFELILNKLEKNRTPLKQNQPTFTPLKKQSSNIKPKTNSKRSDFGHNHSTDFAYGGAIDYSVKHTPSYSGHGGDFGGGGASSSWDSVSSSSSYDCGSSSSDSSGGGDCGGGGGD